MAFKIHQIVAECVEKSMSDCVPGAEFKNNFTKGYLRNGLVELREADNNLSAEVLVYLLSFYNYCYETANKQMAEELARFIGVFINCYEIACLSEEFVLLDDIVMDFMEELS